jgi:aspartate aminotransferase
MSIHNKTTIISEKLKLIKPSPTIAVTTKARELKDAGKDVIDLGVGEPDFDTPENIKQAAYDAIKAGKTKYTPVDGIPALKKSIVDKFQRENNLSYDVSEITVGCGAKHVIFNILSATLNHGDEVIIPTPFWVSYPDITLINGGKPVITNTFAGSNFKLTPELLEGKITAKTKWLILNSPSNPTGSCYNKDELKALANVLSKHSQVHVISDDIYEHIRYEDTQYTNIANVNADMKARTLVVNGVSKAYAMTGWRIGYAAGDKSIIKAIGKIQSQSTSNPCSISQHASIEALSNRSEEFITKNKILFKRRRDLLLSLLKDIPGLTTDSVPIGAFYVFPSCFQLLGKKKPNGEVITNCTDFAKFLLEEALVAVVAGVAFGSENFFRVSYATSEVVLEKACARIKASCAKLS